MRERGNYSAVKGYVKVERYVRRRRATNRGNAGDPGAEYATKKEGDMQDFEMRLDNGESAKIGIELGAIPAISVGVFVWSKSSDQTSVAIMVEGEEKFVVEVSDRGKRITVKKNV